MVVRPNVLNVDELLRLFRAKRGVRVLDYEIDLIIRLLQPRALMTYESLRSVRIANRMAPTFRKDKLHRHSDWNAGLHRRVTMV